MMARVTAAFDAAEDYDRHAGIQREAAALLARRIGMLPLPRRPKVLEIGCGTGFLGAALADRFADADWLATDISAAMLERARDALGERRGFRFALLDGEAPDVAGPFDLVCANLAVQWFTDLAGSLARLRSLLVPGGYLAVTTLAEGSFAGWRAAHAAHGLDPGTRDYPSIAALEATLRGASIEHVSLVERYATGTDFVRALKAIGAGVPRAGHVPLAPSALRAVLRTFERDGAIARYEIALCVAGARAEPCA